MFDGTLMKKLKGKESKMHEMHKDAKLGVLKDLSEQAGKAMSVKIQAKPSDMPEAMDDAKDKVLDVIKSMNVDDSEEEAEEGSLEEVKEELEGDDAEELEDSPDLGEDLEEKVEDYSNISPDELDDRIEKLIAIREKMKTATF